MITKDQLDCQQIILSDDDEEPIKIRKQVSLYLSENETHYYPQGQIPTNPDYKYLQYVIMKDLYGSTLNSLQTVLDKFYFDPTSAIEHLRQIITDLHNEINN